MALMGLTSKNRIKALLAIGLFLILGRLEAQTTPSGQLGPEIQRLEQKLYHRNISSTERHEAQLSLARLLQLSGDIAGAARRWLEAAASDPHDDDALVAGAFCLAAIGEWEKAISTINPLLAAGRRGQAALKARYLNACLKARSPGDASALAALAGDPEYAELHPLIYYSLWRIIIENPSVSTAGSAESWKSRLLVEYPQSPEGRAVNAASVSAVQSPLWMLLPGPAGSGPVAPARPAPASAPAANSPNAASSVVLQTGLFSREANARAQVEELRKAGFSATVTRKLVSGAEHWVVTVPGGQNSNRTIQDLKRAGFDSFPVRN